MNSGRKVGRIVVIEFVLLFFMRDGKVLVINVDRAFSRSVGSDFIKGICVVPLIMLSAGLLTKISEARSSNR